MCRSFDDQKTVIDDNIDNPFDAELKTILQNFTTVMKKGYPEIGIPILDPYIVPQFDVPHISNDIIEADITIGNITGRNLSMFEIISRSYLIMGNGLPCPSNQP